MFSELIRITRKNKVHLLFWCPLWKKFEVKCDWLGVILEWRTHGEVSNVRTQEKTRVISG